MKACCEAFHDFFIRDTYNSRRFFQEAYMMHTKLLVAAIIGGVLLTVLTGCGGDDSASDETVTPYERVAELGATTADWSDVGMIADSIAVWIDTHDESNATDSGLAYPSNWIVGGDIDENGLTIAAEDRILGIPKAYTDELNITLTQKIQVIELCNRAYATQATGTGRFHGPALPCEVSVHKEGDKIYVEMLNPEAIFTLFFQDLSETEKTALKGVASAVKDEIRGMILAALADNSHTVRSEAMGPRYETDVTLPSPYRVFRYSNDANETTAQIAARIIQEGLGLPATEGSVSSLITGVSDGALWRSGRAAPLPIPGVQIIEACSPKYAKMATALGAEYVTALPCEIGVYVDEATGETMISFLDPNFMFTVMFADALNALSADELQLYEPLPDTVFSDLKLIVEHVLGAQNLTEQP
jgi:uncharacterized protein (DUF302 family)